MTDKEILTKAIDQARMNGYNGIECLQLFMINDLTNQEDFEILKHLTIYSHGFCKAIWGKEEIDIELFEVNQNTRGIKAFNGEMFDDWDEMGGLHWFGESWKYHLQQMVLEKEPLKYLEKFLNKDKK